MNEFYDDDEFLLHFLLSKIFSKIQVVLFEGLQNDTRIILRSSIILFYAQRVQNLSQTLEGFRKQSGSFLFFFSVEHLRTTLAHVVSSIARDARAPSQATLAVAAAERGEDDRGKTHVDAKQAEVAGVEGEPFHRAHEALDLVLVGEVDVGVLVAAADLFETDHRARKRVVSPKRSSVEAKGVSVTPAVALRCDRRHGI